MTKKRVQVHFPKRIALYVIYDKDGKLDGFRKYYLQQLRQSVDYIVAIVSGSITPESRNELEKLTNDIFVRENKGLLAGAWVDGLAYVGWDRVYQYDELLMLNDSFFGPFFPLQDFFDSAEKSDADFYGCSQNFEEPTITRLGNKPLKHGFFRGSISYFYIIKKRLLTSSAFKTYWSKMPPISQDWDTYRFAEVDFFDYVKDNGFRIDAYQTERLKTYFFNNLTHCMYRLLKEDKIPFIRMRALGTDLLGESLNFSYGQDPRQTLDYIEKYTQYDSDLIWNYLLRTKHLSYLYNQFQLKYVLSKGCVEKPFTYNAPIAVIGHIYGENAVRKIADYAQNFPLSTDFYITTNDERTKKSVNQEFRRRKLRFTCRVYSDKRGETATLWSTYAQMVISGKYEYICYFHEKKLPVQGFTIAEEEFERRCYENLFGSPELVKNIINLLEKNPRLGVLGAPQPYHASYFDWAKRTWAGCYPTTLRLIKHLKLSVPIQPDVIPVFPYGHMFWFRAKALKKVLEVGSALEELREDSKHSFSMVQAIERLYAFAAQDSGYYYADVINTDEARSDLVNFQYMIQSLCQIMSKHGQWPYSFDVMKTVLESGMSYLPHPNRPVYTQWNQYYYWKYYILSKVLRTPHYKAKYRMLKEWKANREK